MDDEMIKAHKAKLAKRARHLAALGKPRRVTPAEFEQALRIMKKAHASGMSMTQIGEQMGLQKSTVGYTLAGKRKSMYRESYEAALRLQPELPERTGGTRRGGAKVDPLPTVRRLQALCGLGWTSKAVAPYVGMDARNLSNIVLAKVRYVYAVTEMEIAAAYDKVQYMDPLANGETAIGIARGKARAARMGWAPPWCWDEDTIKDPAAHPEWTGACGTPEGYAIHAREGIKVCEVCDAAVRKDVRHSGGVFSPPKFRILIEQRGLTVNEVAERAQATDDSIRRWSAGERSPNPKFLNALASALDCTLSDLLDADGEDVFFDSNFNRGAFAAALEEKNMSKRQLAAELGVSNMAVHYWLTGKNTPKIPKIAKAAEVLGMDWKDFYR